MGRAGRSRRQSGNRSMYVRRNWYISFPRFYPSKILAPSSPPPSSMLLLESQIPRTLIESGATGYLPPISAHPNCSNSNSSGECAGAFTILILLHSSFLYIAVWRETFQFVLAWTASRKYNLLPLHRLNCNTNAFSIGWYVCFYLFVLHISWMLQCNYSRSCEFFGPSIVHCTSLWRWGRGVVASCILCTRMIIFHY